MRIGKNEKKQLKLVEDWERKHPAGIEVIVKKDNQTEQRTKTRSAAYMLGASGDYPGHTAVIMLDGISGCYALERVRPLNILQDSDDPLIRHRHIITVPVEIWEGEGLTEGDLIEIDIRKLKGTERP